MGDNGGGEGGEGGRGGERLSLRGEDLRDKMKRGKEESMCSCRAERSLTL